MAAKFVAALVAVLGLAQGLRQRKRAGGTCGAKGAASEEASFGGEPGAQIVNGDDAPRCAWKWQVGLKAPGSAMPFCGGMLVAPDWVLTAAHCVTDPVFDAVAGDWIPRLPSFSRQTRAAAQVISHPLYNSSSMAFDFALVKLDSPMRETGCVGTVCLPEAGADVQPGTTCWISGWGTLRSGGSQPNILQQAAVTTISNEDCVAKYSYSRDHIRPSMLCAQGRTASGHFIDACQGDSGGPLVCEVGGKFTLFGATSWGFGCASYNYPGIWARVHHALDWIHETMA